MRNRYDFTYSDWAYDVLRTMSSEALKKNYQHLRTVAQKRIKRLASDAQASKSEFYKRWSEGFVNVTALKNKSSLVYGLSDLMRFLSSKSSTLTGQHKTRKEKIRTLQEHGYDVNETTFDEFVRMIQDEKEDKTKYDEIQFQEEWNDFEIRALKLAELGGD